MDKLSIKFCWLIQICIFLAAVSHMQCVSINFKNITCTTWDSTWTSVDYCFVKQVDRLTNSVNFNFRLMIKNNGWQPFLYAVNIDMCRFWKSRYNAMAKMIFKLVDGNTNLNHSCPYTNEKYLSIDNIRNTDVSKSLPNLPLLKGHYAVFCRWSWDNITYIESKIYMEIINV